MSKKRRWNVISATSGALILLGQLAKWFTLPGDLAAIWDALGSSVIIVIGLAGLAWGIGGEILERRRMGQAIDPIREEQPRLRRASPAPQNAPRGYNAAKYERIALERVRDKVVEQVADEVRQQLDSENDE